MNSVQSVEAAVEVIVETVVVVEEMEKVVVGMEKVVVVVEDETGVKVVDMAEMDVMVDMEGMVMEVEGVGKAMVEVVAA